MIKKSKSKVLCLVAAAAISLTSIAGCSTGKKNDSAGTNSATTKEQKENKPKPVLKHLGNFSGFDPNNDPVAKAIEEKTGYKVEYYELPAQNANEKLSLEIASNNSYDSLKLNIGQYNMLTSQGAILEIDKLLDSNGQNIKKVIGNDSWNAIKIKDKTYGVPEKNAADVINTAIAIRQDILEKLNLQVPKTIDEFYNVSKTIKEKTGILPFAAEPTDVLVDTIYSAFGLATQWTDINGTLVHRTENAGMKQYLEFMGKMYKEQLIDPDMPVNKRTNVKEKFSSGQAAMMRFAYFDAPTVLPALEKNVPGAKVAYIEPLIGTNKQQGIAVSKGVQWVACIPKSSKNAEDVIKWYDAKLQEDTHKYIAIGQEGTHYNIKDGKYLPILPAFEKDRNNSSWYLTGIDEQKYPIYWQARVRKNEYQSAAFDQIMKPIATAGKTDPLAWAPVMNSVSKYNTSLSTLEKDTYVKIIAGEGTKGYDEYLKNWNTSGGEEVKKEVNDWYKASKK